MSAARHSLRWRALAAVIGVVVLPLLLVWTSELLDKAAAEGMEFAVAMAASDTAHVWRTQTREQALRSTERLAVQYRARIRVYEGDQLLVDVDEQPLPGIDRPLSQLFFGPDAPTFSAIDEGQPPVLERAESLAARADGTGHGCVRADPGPVLLCTAARRATLADGAPVLVHTQEASRRALRALYDVRFPMIKLTLGMLVIGLIVWVWLYRRLVLPIERLRDQVTARHTADVLQPVTWDHPDEVGDLAAAFNALVGALGARNQANTAFMADLAHEMKNPIAAIRAAGEALEAQPTDEARAKRLATVIGDSSHRLNTLVTQFLALARAEAGLTGDERVIFDLAPLIDGVLSTYRASHPALTFTATTDVAVIWGVPNGIETLLRNLLANAAAFAKSTVDVHLAQIGDTITLTVQDDGPGFAAEDISRAFERFFSRRAGGTGLGLALCQAIVQAHGGRIEARPGPGGKIAVQFPVHTVSTRSP